MGKKIISLSVDEKVYEEYKKICDKKGWILSKQIENFMMEEINNKISSKNKG
jgi:antitoxin component of RelBE/YafQ-DinJ toxin-antitoxin module